MNQKEIEQSCRAVLQAEAKAIQDLTNQMKPDVLKEVVDKIANCSGKIVVSGCGTSGVAAAKIVHSLCCIEKPAVYLSPSDAVHGRLGVLQPEDILILISKGGNTKELINLIPACHTKGSFLIGITENTDSIIGKEAHLCLQVRVEKEPDPFNMLATASILAVIATFDAIIITLMAKTNYTREQFGVIHPGGAVGEKLLQK
ncbi:KpsF/GutQ family sugar-phosphate isomerase [Listeria fleischmannii]|uniref:SIS domain-containing protein n=1 Tax=Listeria fleischmannii TaxID=1069827 RepID=A0A841YGX0_9LIST|nr:SIS domain-containing protein [Listeria fleischmannii]MBC1399394.1 SIS domain-containing protein [Listeria fleischmannii]MBC1427671.1 SIS domain-containing protein [Listeria fleischmannii]